MGPTRKRDLTAATVVAAVAGYLLVTVLYRWFPPITVWTGLSLLAVAIAEGGWAFYVRAKINEGQIGDGPGWLHPLAVARIGDDRQGVGVGGRRWCWAGGSGCWSTFCHGGARCGSPERTPPGQPWRRRARLRCWSPRYGFSIAASHRKSHRTMAKEPRSSWPTIADGESPQCTTR